MAFFAHPFLVRLPYFPSLDYKPQLTGRKRLFAAQQADSRVKPWPSRR
jgi:hypothetical protein